MKSLLIHSKHLILQKNFFLTELISCDIPISFSRFEDVKNSIMKGKNFYTLRDKCNWNPDNIKMKLFNRIFKYL